MYISSVRSTAPTRRGKLVRDGGKLPMCFPEVLRGFMHFQISKLQRYPFCFGCIPTTADRRWQWIIRGSQLRLQNLGGK